MSTVAFTVAGITCAQAHNPDVAAAMVDSFASHTPAVVSSWYNLTVRCDGAAQRSKRQPAPGRVDFVVAITVYSSVTALQLGQVTALVVSVSLFSAAELAAELSPAIAALRAVGGNPVIASGATVAVNGQTCTGATCSSLLNPSSKSSAALSAGALAAITIGSVLFIAAAVFAARCLIARKCKAGTALFALTPKATAAVYRNTYSKLPDHSA